MANCNQCLCEKVCRYNDGHNLYCKEDYECPHFSSNEKQKNVLPKEGFFNLLCGALVYTKTLEEYNKFRKDIKATIYKECIENIESCPSMTDHFGTTYFVSQIFLDNLKKEMVGENNA